MRERILVVDDDGAVRGACGRALEGLGLVVKTAEDADQARRLLAQAPFDLVLTDVEMAPGASGVELAEEIKSRSPATCVIMMTGRPSLETAVRSLKHGASDYLEKPFGVQRLQEIVEACLGRRRLWRELDERESIRRELEAAYAQLQKAEEAKDALLARVSHEMNTPLAVAQLAAGLIEEKVSDAESRELVRRLGGGLEGLRKITEELLIHAKLARRELAVERSEVDIVALCEAVVERYRPLWTEREISIEVRVEGTARLIPASAGLLETAVGNLVLNAVRFNDQGGRVLVRCAFGDRGVDVSVEDTGIGIPEDEIPRAMEGFYQVAGYLTRTHGGLGLGLATARLIVEAHGGTLAVHPRRPRGMTFTVELPVRPRT